MSVMDWILSTPKKICSNSNPWYLKLTLFENRIITDVTISYLMLVVVSSSC